MYIFRRRNKEIILRDNFKNEEINNSNSTNLIYSRSFTALWQHRKLEHFQFRTNGQSSCI